MGKLFTKAIKIKSNQLQASQRKWKNTYTILKCGASPNTHICRKRASAKLRIEGPLTLSKAIYVAQIYAELHNSNTNLININKYMTPPGNSMKETPTPCPPLKSSGKPKIIKFMSQSTENFVTPTNIIVPRNQGQ